MCEPEHPVRLLGGKVNIPRQSFGSGYNVGLGLNQKHKKTKGGPSENQKNFCPSLNWFNGTPTHPS